MTTLMFHIVNKANICCFQTKDVLPERPQILSFLCSLTIATSVSALVQHISMG